ncbi:MAG: tRNA1(Val) (adenine(37)-N6)-methyltransferase [Chitinophagales bacterium]
MEIFRFKKFSVAQDLTAMKVGTDGVLLGAWVEMQPDIKNILDIGTGTGVIALMLAQKFELAKIDAIEIEENAFLQASQNIFSSPWKNRITVNHVSLEDHINQAHKKYDLLVCNPPYFYNNWKVPEAKREMARDAKYFPHELLLAAANQLLAYEGSLNIILPVAEGRSLLNKLESSGLFCKRLTSVSTKAGKPAKRLLIEIVKEACERMEGVLNIENAGINNFSEEYKALTRDYYLHF